MDLCGDTRPYRQSHVLRPGTRSRALFSGDHVMGWSTSVIAPPDGDMGQYLASLDRLAARDDADFLSHPWLADPCSRRTGWLHELIAHRRLREAQILDGGGSMRLPKRRRDSWKNFIQGLDIALRRLRRRFRPKRIWSYLKARGLVGA